MMMRSDPFGLPVPVPSISNPSLPPTTSIKKPTLQNRLAKDLSHLGPIQCIEIGEDIDKIVTVPNGITEETIAVSLSTRNIRFFKVKIVDNGGHDGSRDEEMMVIDGEEDPGRLGQGDKPPDVVADRFHEVLLQGPILGAFAISHQCSITLPPRKLSYAFSTFNSKTVYLISFNEKEKEGMWPETVICNDLGIELEEGRNVKMIENPYYTKDIALSNSSEFLACLLQNQYVVIWEIRTENKLHTFELEGMGVDLMWHPSDPFKLFVAENNGVVRFISVAKERVYMTEYMCRSPLYCCDWAMTNSLICTVGWNGGITIFNTSQCNSNLFLTREQQCKAFKRVRFSPVDDKTIATLERGISSPYSTIRLYRTFVPTSMWSYSSDQIVDMAWMFGKPYLLAVSNRKLFVFDAAAPL